MTPAQVLILETLEREGTAERWYLVCSVAAVTVGTVTRRGIDRGERALGTLARRGLVQLNAAARYEFTPAGQLALEAAVVRGEG